MQGAAKGKRRYRYYVSRSLVRGDSDTPEKGWRISAPEIEQTVSAAAVAMLADESAVTLALEDGGDEFRSSVLCPELVSELA